MIDIEKLKPFILNEHLCIRRMVMRYISEGWVHDPEIVPLVLQACDRYGVVENTNLLEDAKYQPIENSTCLDLLDRLEQSKEPLLTTALGGLIAWAPVDVLDANEERLSSLARKFDPQSSATIKHRRNFVKLTGEQLWRKLINFAEQADLDYRAHDRIDRTYANALVETLALKDVPDTETIRECLESGLEEESWLDPFAIGLAGARKSREVIPVLVEYLPIDDEYMVNQAVSALTRIGDPEAIRLVCGDIQGKDTDYLHDVATLLSGIKCSEAEQAIIELRRITRDNDEIQERLCFALCDQLSPEAIPWCRTVHNLNVNLRYDDVEPHMITIATVHDLELPEMDKWLKEMDESEKEILRKQLEWERIRQEEEAGKKSPNKHNNPKHKPKRKYLPRDEAPSPNDPCPCNSGKKYKKCCGRL